MQIVAPDVIDAMTGIDVNVDFRRTNIDIQGASWFQHFIGVFFPSKLKTG
jgi:hypothetical protein